MAYIQKNEKTTPAQWRALADDQMKVRDESWDRVDNDGFLTQWASQQMAARYRANAAIAEDGYMVAPALFTLDGELITYDRREGDFGPYFFNRQNDDFKKFLTESKAMKDSTARRNNEKKGFRFGYVKVGFTYNDRTGRLEADHSVLLGIDTTDWYADRMAANAA